MKLDKRLEAVADMIPPGKIIADIGTDHAYLPVCLIKRGQIERAIAGEVRKGPYLAAKKTVENAGLESCVSVRLGDGLEAILPGEVDLLVIAGMGGGNIVKILAARPEVTASFERMVLQPMVGAAAVRRYLSRNGWEIVGEDLVLSQDEKNFYQVIAAEKGSMPELETVLYEIGPLLWGTRHPLLKAFLDDMLRRLRYVAASMGKSSLSPNKTKYKAYLKKIKELEDKLLCL